MAHITPGRNGWTENAGKISRAIRAKQEAQQAVASEPEEAARRTRAELEYYDNNNCYPRPMGYFGTETDIHFYER